jgi:hypothetical protein
VNVYLISLLLLSDGFHLDLGETVKFFNCWMRGVYCDVVRVTGCGLARHVIFAVLSGPTRYKKRPIGPCLGRRPGPRHKEAQASRHGGPCRHDTPTGRAGSARWPSIS